jgi:hypothetical protein
LDTGVDQIYGILWWAARLAAGRREPGNALAREIVAVAARQDETTYLMVGYRLLDTMLVRAGQNREALTCLEQAERYRDPIRHKLLSYRFANDPGLLVLCYKIWALMFLGFFDEAVRWASRCGPSLQAISTRPLSLYATISRWRGPNISSAILKHASRIVWNL